MVNITLQFTVFEFEGQRRYKPSSSMAQLYCVTNNIPYATQDKIDQLLDKGYQIIIEEEEPYYSPARD